MAREIPDQWKPFTEPKGITSFRALALRTGLAPTTVIRLLTGEGDPEPDTIERVSEELGLSYADVLALSGSSRHDFGPMDWPEESRYLTPRQRDAVVAVIRSMASPGEEGEGGAVVVGRIGPKPPDDALGAQRGVAKRGEIEPPGEFD